MEPQVIYEDKNFLALDKPAGLLVHPIRLESNGAGPTANSKEKTLVDWLLKHYPEVAKVGDLPALPTGQAGGRQVIQTRPGIVHRLDRDTSGIILIARNQEYFEYLKNLFQTRAIKKTYRALVHGRVMPKKGIIEKEIKIKSGTTKRTVFRGRSEKTAVTEYKLLKQFTLPVRRSIALPSEILREGRGKSGPNEQSAFFSWIEVTPLTGRTHQIRVHLASIGHAVVGDKLYGHKNPKEVQLPGIKRQMLHAYSLEFSPAPGKRVKLAASLPEDIKSTLQYLQESAD